ncbi:NAD-binding of NADP-dependent 3-hydroxyisobutyrate dehydrogenase-domain-containing protein [Kockovaella imperatae]|uniref:3-hydroxyisobutyrate dehydrogenase n=1 Tax=Kockovaella imperatae TaxID=4999 RepID=A0A1Y1U828_9TREE|nr:NAD-binding of NADP-dependent 3-hydroxyisobutyrate dehydrogenase-domain-containing protein [Kockovaella imperatae]ORX34190.1 NAD-binding of NADP-dependent 3-hydroxyisobutyrate dehydrogenase-domain-containing protein [Kockovaella imperatae]
MIPTAVTLSRASTTGWIGLGAMGHHMAINLFTKTHAAHQSSSSGTPSAAPSFVICEQDDARADKFVTDLRNKGGAELAQRVQRAGSGKEVASLASRIMTMLPSTPQVESVYLDPSTGVAAGLPKDEEALHCDADAGASRRPHTILIDGTTLNPTAAMKVAKEIHEKSEGGAVMLDAPVSGGIVAAEAGTLTIMFGSPSPLATALAVPMLQRMAREGGVLPCGANGTGVGVKVCNNLILAINQIALAEGLALGKSLGIDPLLLHNVVNSSSGQSWSSRVNSPLPEVPNSPGSRNYTGGFQSRLMLKDVGLALHAASEYALPTPMTWAARAVYDSVCSEGQGEMAGKDFSVVLEWLRTRQKEAVERG